MDELCSSMVRFDDSTVRFDGEVMSLTVKRGGFDGEAQLSLAVERESTTVERDGGFGGEARW